MPMSNGYQLNEKDIEGTIRFLKTIDPEKATPEMAIALLEYFKGAFHELAHTDPEKLEEILEDLKKQRDLHTLTTNK